VVLQRLGRFDEALSSFDSALAWRPDHLKALLGCGGTLRELGRYAEALESFERALALAPESAEALTDRGRKAPEVVSLPGSPVRLPHRFNSKPSFLEHSVQLC